jgi:hypothetical protein
MQAPQSVQYGHTIWNLTSADISAANYHRFFAGAIKGAHWYCCAEDLNGVSKSDPHISQAWMGPLRKDRYIKMKETESFKISYYKYWAYSITGFNWKIQLVLIQWCSLVCLRCADVTRGSRLQLFQEAEISHTPCWRIWRKVTGVARWTVPSKILRLHQLLP